MNTLLEHMWVRIMTDYCADPVWDVQGANAALSDLPVSPDLSAALEAWEDWFDSGCSDDPIPNFEDFLITGERLAGAVKRELPEWTVIYHDPRLYETSEVNDVEVKISEAALMPSSPSADEIRSFFVT